MLVNPEIHSLAEEFDTKILHHNNNIMIHVSYVFRKLSKKAVEKKYNTENLRISSEVVCNNIQDEVFDNYPLLKKIEKREMDKRKRFIAMAPNNRPIDKNVSTYFAVRACLEIYRRNREQKKVRNIQILDTHFFANYNKESIVIPRARLRHIFQARKRKDEKIS